MKMNKFVILKHLSQAFNGEHIVANAEMTYEL